MILSAWCLVQIPVLCNAHVHSEKLNLEMLPIRTPNLLQVKCAWYLFVTEHDPTLCLARIQYSLHPFQSVIDRTWHEIIWNGWRQGALGVSCNETSCNFCGTIRMDWTEDGKSFSMVYLETFSWIRRFKNFKFPRTVQRFPSSSNFLRRRSL